MNKIDIEKPRWNQDTFIGRVKYFFTITNPINILATNEELENAKKIVLTYKNHLNLKELNISEEELWKAKDLYDSAFHPDTGEKNVILGRMSFQVPGNMAITGCMMTFYKSAPAVIFWQFMNQTFNSIVNYTNRNASTGVTSEQLGQAYIAATTCSVLTALSLNKVIARFPTLSTNGLIGRLVPLAAVAAANFVNIPFMRQRELIEGINIYSMDDNHSNVYEGKSKKAALYGVAQVVPSRILMAAPAMFIPPVIMNYLENNNKPTIKKNILYKIPLLKAPLTILLTGFCLAFSTPVCCALFPQKSKIKFTSLENELQEQIYMKYNKINKVVPEIYTYNKGL